MLRNGTDFGSTVQVDRKAVERVNWYTMFFAHNFVFSNRNSKDFEKAFNETVRGESDSIVLKRLNSEVP